MTTGCVPGLGAFMRAPARRPRCTDSGRGMLCLPEHPPPRSCLGLLIRTAENIAPESRRGCPRSHGDRWVAERRPEPAIRPGIGRAQLADWPAAGKGRSRIPDPSSNNLCQTVWLPTPLSTQATKPQGVPAWLSLSPPAQAGTRQALPTPTQATLRLRGPPQYFSSA